MDSNLVYYVGPTREHTSLTQLFLDLAEDEREKTIYVDAGVYDIFREYKQAGVPTPADDVAVPDYFQYNAFLPLNTKLIGVGNVQLRFAPTAGEVTYGESRTWSPLNILGACHIENIEIYCKNGRYCIHDDSHNRYQNTIHYYKHVRCVYELSDHKDGKLLGFNHTIGNGMAQGCKLRTVRSSFWAAAATLPSTPTKAVTAIPKTRPLSFSSTACFWAARITSAFYGCRIWQASICIF